MFFSCFGDLKPLFPASPTGSLSEKKIKGKKIKLVASGLAPIFFLSSSCLFNLSLASASINVFEQQRAAFILCWP